VRNEQAADERKCCLIGDAVYRVWSDMPSPDHVELRPPSFAAPALRIVRPFTADSVPEVIARHRRKDVNPERIAATSCRL
jgi:hypothetical protein